MNNRIFPSPVASLHSGSDGSIAPRAAGDGWMLHACIVMLAVLPVTASAQAYERDVYVNGQRLSTTELEQLDLQFGACLADGRYWLDSDTGRWGHEGEPASRGKVGALEPQYMPTSPGGEHRQPTAPTPAPRGSP